LIFYSIDATNVDGLGKMVNDSPEEYANAKMKRDVFNNSVHLFLVAVCYIKAGTEIR